MPPKVEGTVTISSATPAPVGSVASFHVESESDDLFVHLTARKDGELVYEGWNRWFGADIDFTLSSPALQEGPADGLALLEDWQNYYRNGRVKVVDEEEFEIV